MLSQEQIESFETNGFLVVQDVLTSEQLAEARRLVDGLIEMSRSVTESNDLFDLDVSHTPERPMIARIKNPGAHAPFLLELGRNDAFVERAWPLIKGPGMLYHGCGRLNMKAAEGGSAVEWHQDTAYGPNTNGDNLTVGLYLDDATVENGCMLMIPGSHKGPALDHHEDRVFVGGIGPGRGADSRKRCPSRCVPAGSPSTAPSSCTALRPTGQADRDVCCSTGTSRQTNGNCSMDCRSVTSPQSSSGGGNDWSVGS